MKILSPQIEKVINMHVKNIKNGFIDLMKKELKVF
jgi:hypothetical protein